MGVLAQYDDHRERSYVSSTGTERDSRDGKGRRSSSNGSTMPYGGFKIDAEVLGGRMMAERHHVTGLHAESECLAR